MALWRPPLKVSQVWSRCLDQLSSQFFSPDPVRFTKGILWLKPSHFRSIKRHFELFCGTHRNRGRLAAILSDSLKVKPESRIWRWSNILKNSNKCTLKAVIAELWETSSLISAPGFFIMQAFQISKFIRSPFHRVMLYQCFMSSHAACSCSKPAKIWIISSCMRMKWIEMRLKPSQGNIWSNINMIIIWSS